MGLVMNVVAIALAAAGSHKTKRPFGVDDQDIEFGNPWWFVYAGVSCFLVLFAGIMSGLTLGLMSMGLVELEILQRSGTSTEKKQAGSLHFFSILEIFTLISRVLDNQQYVNDVFLILPLLNNESFK